MDTDVVAIGGGLAGLIVANRCAELGLRALVLESLWESVREAELDPERYAALAMKQLPAEKDDLTAALLLARLRTVHLRYLTTARRERAQATIERFFWGEATTGTTTSRRIAARLAREVVHA